MSTALSPVTDRALWLAARRHAIGSSDAPVVAGLAGSRLQLWLEKRGLLPDREPSEAMAWGLRLEPLIAAAYAERTGAVYSGEQVCLRHPERPWMAATFDRITADGRIVELKAVGPHGHGRLLGDDDDIETLPEPWIVQGQHQLAVAEQDALTFAVFGPGLRLRTYTLGRSDALIDGLVDLEAEFWDRVETGKPPEEITADDAAALARVYREDDGAWLVLGDDMAAAALAYRELGRTIAALQEQREIHRGRLLQALGNAAGAELPDGTTVARKIVAVREHLVRATTQVRLTMKGPRDG